MFGYWIELTANLVTLYRQVGTLDFGPVSSIPSERLAEVAAELRPGEPGSRIKHVVVPKRHQKEWQALLAGEADPPLAYEPDYMRAFTDPAPRLFARQVAAGVLRGTPYLLFQGGFTPAIARAVADSPDAAGVDSLSLHTMSLDAEAADILSRSPHLGRLRAVTVNGIDWTPPATAAWLGSWLADRLTVLTLVGCGPFGDADLAAFLDKSWPHLEALTLPADGPTWAGVRRLLASGTLPRLERFTWQTASGMATDPLRLRLERTAGPREMTFEAAALRLGPAGQPDRHRLQVSGDLARVWPAEARAFDWAGVSEVVIGLARVDPGWFTTLADCFPNGLDTLEINALDGLKVAHATALAAALPVLRLRSLGLANNGLGIRSLKTLVSSPGVATLRQLDLSDNPLPESAVDALARSPHLGQLEELTVRDAFGFGPSAKTLVTALHKRLPKTTRVVAT